MSLEKKYIIIGVTGGIAAYKSAYLVRELKKQGADVQVVMTESAKSFITELTLQALSGHPVLSEILDPKSESGIEHIEKARKADAVIIAPATANTISKINMGMADNLLTGIVLATTAPVFLAPAMNEIMWKNQITQNNIQSLRNYGFHVINPGCGFQACGGEGEGRMAEPHYIADFLDKFFNDKPLKGKKVIITAGPTVEPIDPVRYISNHSSGKMGYALAKAAYEFGADVTIISGPVHIARPEKIEVISVKTAKQMLEAVRSRVTGTDIFISCAAVSDYTVEEPKKQKIKKEDNSDELTLRLIKNTDILSTIAHSEDRPMLVVGFAAETENLEEYATKKLRKKNADIIVANDVSDTDIGFNSDNNAVTIFSKELPPKQFSNRLKTELGHDILIFCIEYLKQLNQKNYNLS